MNLASLILTAFGTIILAGVGQLTWYDITVWGKDIVLIFFGSRTGEAISLGIGVRVIHYLLIGLVLFLSGIFAFLRKRRLGANGEPSSKLERDARTIDKL
ncbi:hypothetical protein GH146_02490 [archaeon]|nr:hypothetical protein [archaeon]